MERDESTCCELLGLSPGATPEQVERAYRFYSDLYRENSLATYSLLSPEELLAARTRVEEAYEMLTDLGRHRSQGASLGLLAAVPAVAPPTVSEPVAYHLLPPPATAAIEVAPVPETSGDETASAVVLSAPAPAAPAVHPEPRLPPFPDPVTGAALKAYRLAKGVSLRDIANQSKIGVRFLEYIEADRFHDLPAPVYIRGFLREYARACGLDPARITDSYLSRIAEP